MKDQVIVEILGDSTGRELPHPPVRWGGCQFSGGAPIPSSGKQFPFYIDRLRIRLAENPGNFLILGQIRNPSNKVYRLGMLTVRIGDRIEEIPMGGLISPNQSREIWALVEKGGTRYSTPIVVDRLEYAEYQP